MYKKWWNPFTWKLQSFSEKALADAILTMPKRKNAKISKVLTSISNRYVPNEYVSPKMFECVIDPVSLLKDTYPGES